MQKKNLIQKTTTEHKFRASSHTHTLQNSHNTIQTTDTSHSSHTSQINQNIQEKIHKSPLFISFEGPDCVGKSTQINLFSNFLFNHNIQHVTTREPSNTAVGNSVSQLTRNESLDAMTETMLLIAQRIDHIEKIIKPNLNNAHSVITDRYHDSTIAYQCYGKNADLQFINSFLIENSQDIKNTQDTRDTKNTKDVQNAQNTQIFQNTQNTQHINQMIPQPDITFILNLPIDTLMKRISRKKNKDNFELKDINFFQQVVNGYNDIFKKNSHRCIMIDANQSIEKVHQDICNEFVQKIL